MLKLYRVSLNSDLNFDKRCEQQDSSEYIMVCTYKKEVLEYEMILFEIQIIMILERYTNFFNSLV